MKKETLQKAFSLDIAITNLKHAIKECENIPTKELSIVVTSIGGSTDKRSKFTIDKEVFINFLTSLKDIKETEFAKL